MNRLRSDRARLAELAETIRSCGIDAAALSDALAPLDQPQIDATVLGQTKAGKTATVNALAGMPGLLPVDVNPWTAVVTSVHLGRPRTDNVVAEFEFYDEAGWRGLVEGAGGAAARALRGGDGAATETLRRQLEALQARARARLGRNFEMLLGGRHRLDSVDRRILSRYVVLGEGEGEVGRYAELTRRADIWLQDAGWGLAATLRDTPGVNDPLLVREQATLEALGEADVGILVLNATQAMTTADLGLLRALATLGRTRVIVFVNRIDDLGRPSVETPKIAANVRATLERAGVSSDAPLLWGSAAWAEAAAADGIPSLPPHSRAAFEEWRTLHPDATLETASGIPALRALLTRISAERRGRAALRDAAAGIANLASARIAAMAPPSPEEAAARADALCAVTDRHSEALNAMLDAAAAPAFESMRRTVALHAEREEARVRQAVLDKQGGELVADLQPLRASLAEQHDRFAAKVESALVSRYRRLAEDVMELAAAHAAPGAAPLTLSPPQPPRSLPPAALARTVALDLGESWWGGWFRRETRADKRAAEMRRLIEEEMAPVLEELRAARIDRYAAEARARQRGFLKTCVDALLPPPEIARASADAAEKLRDAADAAQEILRRNAEAPAPGTDADDGGSGGGGQPGAGRAPARAADPRPAEYGPQPRAGADRAAPVVADFAAMAAARANVVGRIR